MIYLKSVNKKPSASAKEGFPFSTALVRKLRELEFRSAVTFFVGENGSGKSTLLEAIASGAGSITVGGVDLRRDKTLNHARDLSKHLKFVWTKKTARGFFLRAEDFFNFARRTREMVEELEELASSYEHQFNGAALSRAKGAVLGQRAALIEKYGEDLVANSHGESFLKLFQMRFVPGGLYLLDEPEAPLSPLRQLAFLSMLNEMVEQDAQFIIATHSPIIMAFPGAAILNFDNHPIREIGYDDLEHVNLTRAFLNNPEAYLRRL